MAELSLYNTLTRQKEPIRPLDGETVRLYACGPTVYNLAHIGNFRSFLFQDLLRRTLKAFGYSLKHVLNVTDVDDKTIRGSRQAGQPLREFTSHYLELFLQDLKTLNIEAPEFMPRATDCLPPIIALIEKLVEKQAAYVSNDGSVYYRIKAFPRYGCLGHLDLSGLVAGARVSQDEYEKETYGDFALWKAWVPEDGEVGWDSPWGRGRPGWHIECSAMSMHFLGESFDLHCGGIDLKFPHHENEIAQSEAATGKTFVKHWAHSEHLLVEGQKMAKSLGNMYTVQQVLERGYQARELRYALLATSYRKQLNFTWEGMDGAKTALARIDAWRSRFGPKTGAQPRATEFLRLFREALQDDLNISEALGHLFDFIRDTNKLLDAGEEAGDLAMVWAEVEAILGLGEPVSERPSDVEALLEQRKAVRAAKNFKESDRLRDEIAALGWVVKDTPQGQELRKK
jgi:cysteinyl-tRNA synthetase